MLRHNPAAIGATLDEDGWIGVEVLFYRAANGVWLTSHVPPEWIERFRRK